MKENKTYKAFPITEELLKKLELQMSYICYKDGESERLQKVWDAFYSLKSHIEQPTYSSVTAEEIKCKDCGCKINEGEFKTFGVCDKCYIKAHTKEGMVDWNTFNLDQLADVLEKEYKYNSSGIAYATLAIVDFYKKNFQLQTCQPSFPKDEEIESKFLKMIRNELAHEKNYNYFEPMTKIIAKECVKITKEWLSSYIGESKKDGWMPLPNPPKEGEK